MNRDGSRGKEPGWNNRREDGMLDVPPRDDQRFDPAAMRTTQLLALAALGAAMALPRAGAAQAVQGRVTERPNGDALSGALVSLVGPDDAVVATARTGGDGTFLVAARQEGVHRVRVELIGYRPAVSTPVRLSASDTLDVDVALPLQVVLLDSIHVVSRARRRQSVYVRDFYDRVENNPFGEYITRADIELAHPGRVTELFTRVAGIRLVPTRTGNLVELRGGCSPTFYVDGTRVFLGYQTIDELVPPGDVEGIEVYKSIAGAPVQAHGINGGCSAIFFWTRLGDGR